MWRNWCSDHPATVLYIMVITSLNFVLSVMEVLR